MDNIVKIVGYLNGLMAIVLAFSLLINGFDQERAFGVLFCIIIYFNLTRN